LKGLRGRIGCFLGLALLLAPACRPAEPPSVILVTIDTLRADEARREAGGARG